jgi:HAD superfamily hydrolase (TIGR01509 family)
MKLETLIFDVDGTLADTERDGHRPAYNAAFRDAGLPWDWDVDLYGRLLAVTGGKERIRHYIDHCRSEFRRPDDLDGFIAELHAVKTRHFTELVRGGAIPLRPGVERLLREARDEGLRLAIATTTTPENVEALLETALGADALRWFDFIGAGDVVSAKKPAPDIYQHVIEAMDIVPGPGLAFEDSGNGVLAARAARIRTVVTVNGYTNGQDFSGAVLVLDHLGEPGMPCRAQVGQPLLDGETFVTVPVLRHVHGIDP